ncbi:MAG TPA: hypothetical protein PLX02_12825 [Syntrophorhabdaceae bacterium]|nr:hypothetical protein [Syntrophorhabdaceae bacterium]HQM82495.1 hypothetical protein [Syntrophorhabdaceae bacterium]
MTQSERTKIVSKKTHDSHKAAWPVVMNGALVTVLILSLLFTAALLLAGSASAAERRTQRPAAVVKESSINDSNVRAILKRTDDQLKKNDFINTLDPSLKINNFAKDVLSSVEAVRACYEKAINDPATPQNEKEYLVLKLQRLEDVEKRYKDIYEASTFNLGYIYAKRGSPERGRKYLSEYIKIAPFSAKKDSQWMRAKTLLLELYGLEGEF